MPKPAYPTLYQIFTRVWLNELSRELGRPATLYDVSDGFLDTLSAHGFDWFWPLGVWQTGPVGREMSMTQPASRADCLRALPDLKDEDITGSPFAVSEYRVHEDFGGDDALAQLRRRLARRGIRLLLDFVPNHTARDHGWVTSHPEYYVHGTDADLAREPENYARVDTRNGPSVLAYGRDPYFPGWADTFQLNYRCSALREAMQQQLLALASVCDGVRCDMAMLLLPDVIARTWGARARPVDGSIPDDRPFWLEAIAAVRSSHEDFTFVAEVYWDREWELQQQGFDYTCDKRLYDRLRSRDVAAVRGHLHADPDFQQRSLRFLENHDEPRAAATFPPEVHRAAATVAFLVPGLRFFYDGQLEGRRQHVPMHIGRRPDEPVDRALQDFYTQLLAVLRLPVVRRGDWRLLSTQSAWPGNPTASQFIAMSWELGANQLLICVNYGPTPAQCYVRLPWPDLSGLSFCLSDLLSHASYARSGDDLQRRGLYLDVPAWHAHVFVLERA